MRDIMTLGGRKLTRLTLGDAVVYEASRNPILYFSVGNRHYKDKGEIVNITRLRFAFNGDFSHLSILPPVSNPRGFQVTAELYSFEWVAEEVFGETSGSQANCLALYGAWKTPPLEWDIHPNAKTCIVALRLPNNSAFSDNAIKDGVEFIKETARLLNTI